MTKQVPCVGAVQLVSSAAHGPEPQQGWPPKQSAGIQNASRTRSQACEVKVLRDTEYGASKSYKPSADQVGGCQESIDSETPLPE